MSASRVFAYAVSTHHKCRRAAAEMVIRHARLRAPVAHLLLDRVMDLIVAARAMKLNLTEIGELNKLAIDLADCGMFECSGDISPFMDRAIRGRLNLIVAAAGKR